MKRPPDRLDPSKFTIAPHVAVLDEFRMTNDDGTFVADITPAFLDRLVAHMNEREAGTGDMCPGVIGHTQDGLPEVAQPPVTAFLRNWVVDDLFETGRKAAFADIWVFNEDVETVKKYPRRSAEVWVSRYEIDPLSFLGATTPSRDLGLMRLSRNGSLTYECPGEMTMAEPTKKDEKDTPKDDPKETGAAKGAGAKDDQILALLTQILTTLSGGAAGAGAPGAAGAAPPPGAPAGAPGAEGAAGAGGDASDMSDEEFENLMKELEGGQGGGEDKGGEKGEEPPPRKGQEPVKESAVQLSRVTMVENENAALRVKLARQEIKAVLTDARANKHIDVNPEDELFVSDLAAMPDDMRARTLDKVIKNARPLPSAPAAMLDAAVGTGTVSGKRIGSVEERDTVIKLARESNVDFATKAREMGYTL